MPTPSKAPAAKAPKSTKPSPNGAVAAAASPEWASLVESGAGLTDELDGDDAMSAPIERAVEQPFSLKAEFKKHPVLYIGLGALAVTGLAAFLGRGAIARTARPIIVRSVRPVLIRAAAARPLETAKLAARYPRAAAKLAAEGLRSVRRG